MLLFFSLLQAETAKAELEEERRQVRLDCLMLFFPLCVCNVFVMCANIKQVILCTT